MIVEQGLPKADWNFEDWGLIDYTAAQQRQLDLVDQIAKGHKDTVVFCSHPPVVTRGRSTQDGDIDSWQGDVIDVARGGRATYHGPSQIVIYVLANLRNSNAHRGPQDVVGFLRGLENALVSTLDQLGIAATGKSLQRHDDRSVTTDETGVWVGNRKIASLGIAVRKWVTYHGAALNLENDPLAFQGMRPCGFRKETMISVEELLNKRVSREAVIDLFKAQVVHFL